MRQKNVHKELVMKTSFNQQKGGDLHMQEGEEEEQGRRWNEEEQGEEGG